MPKQKRNEIVAGLFVIAALAATLGIVLWLGVSDIFRPAKQRAFFYVEEKDGSTGLKVGNFVHITDKEIGQIVDIRYIPADRRTLYEVKIDQEGVKIHQDATATVSAGLVGNSKLVITSRGTKAKPLADTKHPAHITGGLDAAMQQMSSAVEKLDTFITTEFDRTHTGALMQKIHVIADNIENTTTVLSKITDTLTPETQGDNEKSMIVQVRQSISNIKDTTADIKTIAADAKPKVGKLLTSATATAEQIEKYAKKDIAEIFATLRKANDKILTISSNFADVSHTTKQIIVLNRDNIDRMIDNMTLVSESLKATAAEIRANPWRLLYKPKKDELHSYSILTATTAFSEGTASLERSITKLKNLDPKTYDPKDPEIRKIRKHLNDTFRKFKKVEDTLWKEMEK